MNKNLKYGIVIIVLVLAIGFAAVATNIIVNGNASLGFKSSDYDIYFSRAIPEDDGVATIDPTTKKTITYSTKTLSKVGDQAVLDYVVTNASTQYDARCTVEFEIDSGASEYVTISQIGFSENEPTMVNAQSNQRGRVKITLKKGSMEPIQIHFTITLNFEPVGKNESAEEGTVPGSDEEPDEDECVPSGYYELRCSCDNHTIAWLGGPYLDAQGNAMNANRTRDINYPPANTYICGCDGGSTGYVVNTGVLLDSECPAPQPAPDENRITNMKIDNRSTIGHYDWFRLPGYDDETGNNLRESYILDIYTEYKNADVEVIEYDYETNEPVADSNIIEYLGKSNKKYSYRINLRTPTTDEIEEAGSKSYIFKVILRSKTDPTKIYDTDWVWSLLEYESGYDVQVMEGYLDYHVGVKPWTTWFMNDGRDVFCRYMEECSNFIAKIDNNVFHNKYDYMDFQLNGEWEYNVDVPGYDNSGTNKRSSVNLDLELSYDYQNVELVEVNSTSYYASPIANSNKVEFLSSSGNTYSYRINLPTDVTSNYVRYYFRVYIRDKTTSQRYNSSQFIILTVRYGDTSQKKDANGNTYEYYEGKAPWATWFS